jgi:hypothetical protein
MQNAPSHSCGYELDENLNIVSIDAGWSDFARANGAPELASAALLGRPLMSRIAGDSTAHLYETLFDKVRRTRRPIVLPFRCDSPTQRRFLELTIAPGSRGLRVSSTLLRVESRLRVSLLDPRKARSDEFLRMCSFCKQVKVEAGWCEVEDAVVALRLFERDLLPVISHGVCPACLQKTLALLDAQ